MKVVGKLLSDGEKKVLADFYMNEDWRILKRFLDNEVDNILKNAISSQDIETLRHFQGQLSSIKRIESELQRINKEVIGRKNAIQKRKAT